jgi:hypothetical protein
MFSNMLILGTPHMTLFGFIFSQSKSHSLRYGIIYIFNIFTLPFPYTNVTFKVAEVFSLKIYCKVFDNALHIIGEYLLN